MNEALLFDEGIPGFPDARRFLLEELVPDGVFHLFRNLDDPDLAMVVADPWTFFPDYAPELTELEKTGLELGDSQDAIVFCSVRFDEDGAVMNLVGPFVVNIRTGRGCQIVLTDQELLLRAQLVLD